MIDLTTILAAAAQFTPMTDIPFLTGWSPGANFTGTPSTLFNRLFSLSIQIGAMLAVFMFIWGGLQKIMAKDSSGSVGEGNKKMTNAVVGLLMLISTFVVLNTINPQLVSLNILGGSAGLQKLQAPPEVKQSKITQQRNARVKARAQKATAPKTTNATNRGTHCYQDTGYSTNFVCFATASDCSNAILGSRVQSGCKTLSLSPNERNEMARLESSKSLSVLCTTGTTGRSKTKCTSGTGYYNKCPVNALCKTTVVSQAQTINDGKYNVSGLKYNNKKYCELYAKTQGLSCI